MMLAMTTAMRLTMTNVTRPGFPASALMWEPHWQCPRLWSGCPCCSLLLTGCLPTWSQSSSCFTAPITDHIHVSNFETAKMTAKISQDFGHKPQNGKAHPVCWVWHRQGRSRGRRCREGRRPSSPSQPLMKSSDIIMATKLTLLSNYYWLQLVIWLNSILTSWRCPGRGPGKASREFVEEGEREQRPRGLCDVSNTCNWWRRLVCLIVF